MHKARKAEGESPAILVRTPNWLGDLMMSTSFVRAVLHRFPTARVDLIVRAGFQDLPLPHRGRIYAFDKRVSTPGAFGRRFRKQGYSHFFVLPPSLSSAWMAFRSGIPHRIGYRGEGRGWLLRPAYAHRHAHRSVHLVQEYLDLLRPWAEVDAGEFPAGMDLPPGWLEGHRPQALHGEVPYVVLAPGAEYGPAKQWPAAYYQETAAALTNAGQRVVVVGLAKDRDTARTVLAHAPAGLDLCGETDVNGLVAVLAGASLLISNDSGAMHVGAALGLPQIAVLGSTNPAWTGPLNPKARVLYRSEPCSPCYARTCPLGHTRCLRALLPQEVIDAAQAMLERRGDSPA